MKPIILRADQDGNLMITADKIQQMVEDAYNEGVADGKAIAKNSQPLTYPDLWQTTPSKIPSYYGTEITCGQDSK